MTEPSLDDPPLAVPDAEPLLVEVPPDELPDGTQWAQPREEIPQASFTLDPRQRVYERKRDVEVKPRSRTLPILALVILVFVGLTVAWAYREQLAQSARMLLMRNAQEEGKSANRATVSGEQITRETRP